MKTDAHNSQKVKSSEFSYSGYVLWRLNDAGRVEFMALYATYEDACNESDLSPGGYWQITPVLFAGQKWSDWIRWVESEQLHRLSSDDLPEVMS